MKKTTKRILKGAAFLGALGTLGAILIGKGPRKQKPARSDGSTWARPGMLVTFRAELMPGRETSERTFRVIEFLTSGRVLLEGVSGEHAENEFEKIR